MGVLTNYGFLYKPALGALGQTELDSFNEGFNRVDAHLDKTIRYGESSTGNDSYAISASPVVSDYRSGQIFAVKADVVNTGACTLNVDSNGAVNIQKWSDGAWADLDNGDIHAGQIFVVVYDGNRMEFVGDLPQRVFTLNPFIKTSTAGLRIKDTSGKDILIRVNGNDIELCDNTGTESSPSWTTRLTIAGATGLVTLSSAVSPATINDLIRKAYVDSGTARLFAKIYRSSNYTMNVGVNAVTFNAKAFDPYSISSTYSTGKITPTIAGYYLCMIQVSFITGSSCSRGTLSYARLYDGNPFSSLNAYGTGVEAYPNSYYNSTSIDVGYFNGSSTYLNGYFQNNTSYAQTFEGGVDRTNLELIGPFG